MSTFTKLLINARNQKGLTKTQVADIFGWTRMYYGRFENGYLLPRGDNIPKFAQFIGVSTRELEKIIVNDQDILLTANKKTEEK